jgi:hypothetical protein
MTTRVLAALIVFSRMVASVVSIAAEEPRASHQEIKLSPDLLDLLKVEMREIATGVQSIAIALATADWKVIQDSSDKIRESYVMEKKLTPDLKKELAHVLPAHFKQLDAEFHQRAARLGAAAAAHDAELAAFHYARLVEGCAICHSAYARSRFPGFVPPVQQDHHH